MRWNRNAWARIVACAVMVGSCVGTGQGARIGFLVAEYPGEQDHGDSYVITIDESDAQRLNQARALVAWVAAGADLETAPDGRIVYTDVVPGADGINRNALADGGPLWSWHPVGEVDFVDISAEIYDGWPTFVEQDVAGWMANTGGGVGFWGYTITQELGVVVPEPASLVGSLTALGLLVGGLRRRRRRGAQRRRADRDVITIVPVIPRQVALRGASDRSPRTPRPTRP